MKIAKKISAAKDVVAGKPVRWLGWLEEAGGILTLSLNVLLHMFKPPFRFELIFTQMRFIGVQSMFVVVLTGIFTGMVFSLQSGRAFRLFDAESLTGAVAGLAITRELGPVLAALMVTGRAGSAIAAELGTMRVTQQIDALKSMAVNPINYLVVPRVIATILVMPLLTAIFDFVSLIGTYVVGVKLLRIPEAIFMHNLKWYIDIGDITQGLFKAACFGFIIAVVGCFKGIHASGGAKGVGLATTQAVVIASVAILVSDYFLTALLF
jgi:phospholipid/cholesterol/gamma-HCH transport system permease protein